MTRAIAEWNLTELDDLLRRVRIQEQRLGANDPELADIRRDVETRRRAVLEYLAALDDYDALSWARVGAERTDRPPMVH